MSELRDLIPEIEQIEKLREVFPKAIKDISDSVKEYQSDMKTIVESTKDAKEQLEKLNPSVKDNQEEIEKLSKSIDENAQSYKNLKGSVQTLEGEIDDLGKEYDEFNKKAEETTKTQKELIKLQNKLSNLNTDEASEIAKVKVQIQERNKALKEQAKETLGVVKTQSVFSQNQDRIAAALENTVPAFKGAQAGGTGLLNVFRAILANPIGLLITAIVTVLGFLFNAFTKTIGGGEKLEQVLAALGAAFDTLTRQIGRLLSGEISLTEFFTETTDAMVDNAKAAVSLVRIRRILEQQTARNTIAEAKLAGIIERLRGIRDNDLISLNRRLEAARMLQKEEEALAQSRIDQAEREARAQGKALQSIGFSQDEVRRAIEQRTVAELQAAASTKDQLEQANAFAESIANIINAENELATVRADTAQQTGTLILDLLDQELDFLIDIDEKRIDSNNKLLASDRLNAAQRESLFLKQEQIINDSLARQIATFEEYLGIQVDVQKLFRLSGKEAFEYAQNLGLPERAAIRLIEITKGSQTAQEDLNESFREFRKETSNIVEISQRTGEAVQIPIKKFRTVLVQTTTTIQQDLQNFLTNVGSIFTESANSIFSFFDAIRQRRNQESEEEIAKLEERTKQQLENENLTAKQREAILNRERALREKLEKEQAERNRRLAIFNKALAITESIIQTALQVVKLGIITPQAILAGILGGVQTAAIAAQPIPAFAKGTSNAPGGLALVGEKGREIIVEPSGRVSLTGNRAELRDIPQGSTVLTNAISERILSGQSESIRNSASARAIQKAIQAERANVITKQLQYVLRNENEDLVQAIKNIIPDVHQYEFENGKLQHNLRRGNTIYKDVQNENRY